MEYKPERGKKNSGNAIVQIHNLKIKLLFILICKKFIKTENIKIKIEKNNIFPEEYT